MKVTIEFDEDKLIHEVMENYPEYSTPTLQCMFYSYERDRFNFLDTEEDKLYLVTMNSAHLLELKGRKVPTHKTLPGLKKGMGILIGILSRNELPGLSINMSNFQDSGEWDSDCADALVQCAIFGEVRYG